MENKNVKKCIKRDKPIEKWTEDDYKLSPRSPRNIGKKIACAKSLQQVCLLLLQFLFYFFNKQLN